MNHTELVARAGKWLRSKRHNPVLLEAGYGDVAERPDAIGFQRGTSLLIECKANRADFLSDKHKGHRNGPGMGYQRFYFVPKGLVTPEEVPEDWGLLELRGKSPGRVFFLKDAPTRPDYDMRAEKKLLCGALANIQLRDRDFFVGDGQWTSENLGRGITELYRELAEPIRQEVLDRIVYEIGMDLSWVGLDQETKEKVMDKVRASIRHSASGHIPSEAWLLRKFGK